MRARVLTYMIACLVAACGDTKAATRLVLTADTDIERLDGVRFDIEPPGDADPQHAMGDVSPGMPAYLVMEKGDSAQAGPYLVKVTGTDAGATVIIREASVSFVPGKTFAVPLHLVEACIDKTCAANESCGPGGQCGPKEVSEQQLVPWTGMAPTLMPGGDGDGDMDADTPLPDGGDGDGDGGGLPDGGMPCEALMCMDGELAVCNDQGGVIGTVPCQADTCTSAMCVDGTGCVTAAANEGMTCGTGGDVPPACGQGVCGKDFACTTNCTVACNAGVAACALDCGAAANCTATCPADAPCEVHCRTTDRCTPICNGACNVDCDDSKDCRPSCESGSSCDIICPDNSDCDWPSCKVGAQCVLHCVGSNLCKFKTCPGGQIDCGDGRIVCGRECDL